MKNKTKNNILIILIVTFSALTVIALVLITGFSKNGNGSGNSGISVPNATSDDLSDISEQSSAASEPTSAPSESSTADNSESSPGGSSSADDNIGQRIAASASALVGVPFAENGSTPSGFDNSGFIYYVLRENGYITCPRTTDAQSRMGARVGRDSIKPGDLVFFGNNGSNNADFGGIYIGSGKMIACLMPGTTVREVDIMTDYYVANFFGGISLS